MAKFNPLALALLIATASTGCVTLAPAVPDAQPQVRGTWVACLVTQKRRQLRIIFSELASQLAQVAKFF